MKRRILAVMLLIAVLASCLAGCGSAHPGTDLTGKKAGQRL